jgi:hypothetical protein
MVIQATGRYGLHVKVICGGILTREPVLMQELLSRESNVTNVRAPVVVVGDTHGQV